MSLNFKYRVSNVYYYEDGNFISFDLSIIEKGVKRDYPCTFKFTSTRTLRAAFSKQNFGTTVNRNACFVDSSPLRAMELGSDLCQEFEMCYTGPDIHVYDFCKAFREFARVKGIFYHRAF